VNRVIDTVREHCGLEHGVVLPAFHALREHDLATLTDLAEATAAGQIQFRIPTGRDGGASGRLAEAIPSCLQHRGGRLLVRSLPVGFAPRTCRFPTTQRVQLDGSLRLR